MPSLSSTARALLAARSSSPVTAGLCRPQIPAESIYYKEVGRHRHKRRKSERFPEHSPRSHNFPCPFSCNVSPSVLGHIPWRMRPDQRQDTNSKQISSSDLPISQHSMSGYEEPGVPILLEMAGFEFLVRILQIPTRKCPKGLRHSEHCPPGRQTPCLPFIADKEEDRTILDIGFFESLVLLELPGVVIKCLLPGRDALPYQESPQVHHRVPGPDRQGHHQVLISQVHLDVVPLPPREAPAQRVHPLRLSRAAVAEHSIQLPDRPSRDVALKRLSAANSFERPAKPVSPSCHAACFTFQGRAHRAP